MTYQTRNEESEMLRDASIVLLANHYKSVNYGVNSFLHSYGQAHRLRMIEHLFSLGLTNLGIDRWDLDWA